MLPSDVSPEEANDFIIPFKAREERIRIRSRLPNFSYYTREYALAIKPVVDRMIASGKPQIFDASKHRKALTTLRMILTRSLYYLSDYLDDSNNTYETFQRQTTFITDRENNTIILQYSDEGKTNPRTGSANPKLTSNIAWREPFGKFIEEGEPGSVIEIAGLTLNEEDMEYILGNMIGMDEIIEVITLNKSTIKMRRK